MSLHQYYHQHFRQDLQSLFHNIPAPEARIVALGYNWIEGCSFLKRVDPDSQPAFLVCLHFTVLMDQSMHSHFRFNYGEFEKLTLYPKFRLGLGHPAYLNPVRILEEPIARQLVEESAVRSLVAESMQLFVRETDDFFTHHLPAISAIDFFGRVLDDPEVAMKHVDDNGDDLGKLSLWQLVAHELGKAVSEILKPKV